MQRSIDAPPQEWLSRKEAAAWLNIEDWLFDALVKRPGYPAGVKATHKTRIWHWSHVYSLSVLLTCQPISDAEIEAAEK